MITVNREHIHPAWLHRLHEALAKSEREKDEEEDERFHQSSASTQAGLFSSLVFGFLRYFAFSADAKFVFFNPPFEPKPFLRHPPALNKAASQ